jgi:hypothetical protein
VSARLSIVVCTFNPHPILIGRALSAVSAAQQATPFDVEVIVVDNNSEPAVASLSCVAAFLRAAPARHLVVERRQGLTHARLAGFDVATAPALVFVDDDNLLAEDYFSAAAQVLARFPDVAVCGPGVVEVQWEAGTPSWVRGYATCFQERREALPRFGAEAGWPDFYPAGTGMVVRRDVFAEYARNVRAGRLDASGRSGAQLTSGEDNQIVWTAVHMGQSAGVSPALRLTHVVERRKATLRYVLRLVFATMASGRIVARQSFPDRPDLWAPRGLLAAHRDVFVLALKELLLLRLRSGPVKVVRHLGDVHGQFLAAGQRPPWLTRAAARLLDFSWGSP